MGCPSSCRGALTASASGCQSFFDFAVSQYGLCLQGHIQELSQPCHIAGEAEVVTVKVAEGMAIVAAAEEAGARTLIEAVAAEAAMETVEAAVGEDMVIEEVRVSRVHAIQN